MGSKAVKTGRVRSLMGLIIILVVILMGACGSDGSAPVGGGGVEPAPEEPAPEEPAPEEPAPEEPAPEEPAPEEPAPEEPAPEEPAPEQPAPEQPAPEETDGEGLTGEEWAVVILLGLAVVAIVAGATALASRGSGDRSEPRPRSEAQWRLDEVTRGCRSIHDSAVTSVLQASNPTMLQSTWGATRPQLIDLEARVGSLAPDVPEESQRQSLYELGHSVAGVRGALEAFVNLRLDPQAPDQADLMEASSRTVLHRSEQLETALQRVLYIRL